MRPILLVLLLVGCANSFVVVPDSEWRAVPAAKRTQMDRDHAEQRQRLEQEHAATVSALAAARKAPPAKLPMAQAPSTAPGDEWAAAVVAFEQRKRAAMMEVANASADWQRARISFHEGRVELASSRLEVLRCAYEVDRAHAVDRNLLGSDTYDSAPYRAQLADTQQRWYAADLRVRATRAALTAATAKLTAKKAAYAELVRAGPQVPSGDDPHRVAGKRDEPLVAPARPRTTRATMASSELGTPK